MRLDVDVALVGAGGAGLSLLHQLDLQAARRRRLPPTVALIDPVHHRDGDRTWCFWDAGHSDVDPAVHRAWHQLAVIDASGRQDVIDLGPLRYVMVRSADFYALAEAAALRLGAVRVPAAATRVLDGPSRAVVHAADTEISARWVFDSRPPSDRSRPLLLQHFRGWTVRFPPGDDAPGPRPGPGPDGASPSAPVDPLLPILMDFTTPQPPAGVSFGYVLPLDDHRALIEYTEVSRARLEPSGYDRALRDYLAGRWGGTGLDLDQVVVEAVEDGAIPLFDTPSQRRVGHRVFRIGAAGGATRAATGYTFATMQRQAASIADALLSGRPPVPPQPYPTRHRWLDAVWLRALDRGLLPGPELFLMLLRGHPPQRWLRFLDGVSSPVEDLAVMRSAPTLPMLRATAEVVAGRVAAATRRAAATGRAGATR